MKQLVKMKQRKNQMRRRMKMKSLVAYGSNLRERMALLCGCLMQAKGGVSPKHLVQIFPVENNFSLN